MKNLIILLLSLPLLMSCNRDEPEPFGFESRVAEQEIIVSVEEFDVPWDDGRSRDPFVAPDGQIYFVGQQLHYVGILDPDTGEFTFHELEEGTAPHNVVVAEDGTVWYAGNRARHIGKMDPETGRVTKYRMEHENARDPHTMVFDADGNLWFTSQSGNGVCHFDVSNGDLQVIPVPTNRARPYGIIMDQKHRKLWIALFGTNKIAHIDPETLQLTEIMLPREEIRPRRLDVTSDGSVWFGDYASGSIGRYDPEDGSVTEWEMPHGAGSRPYAVLTDDKDRVWFSATGPSPNKLVAFDTRNEEFVVSRQIKSARGAIRNMTFDADTRSIWFGTDTGYIVRVIVE